MSISPTFGPEKALTSYASPTVIIPESWKEAKIILEERIINDAAAINQREVAQYSTQEILTGQTWFTSGDATKLRQTFRKVIDLSGLNDFSTTSPQNVAHGLPASSSGFVLTRLYGAATDPGTAYIPLPYVDSAGSAHIELSMDATNIILTSSTDYSAYTTAYAVVEYIRE